MTKLSAALLAIFFTAQAAAVTVEDKTDRFTGDRSVVYSSIPEQGAHSLSTYAFYSKGDPKPQYVLHLLTWGDEWRYLECKSNNWLLDGKPEPALVGKYENSMASSATVERFVYIVPRKVVERIASSKTVEFKVCSDEGVVSSKDLEGLRQVLQTAR